MMGENEYTVHAQYQDDSGKWHDTDEIENVTLAGEEGNQEPIFMPKRSEFSATAKFSKRAWKKMVGKQIWREMRRERRRAMVKKIWERIVKMVGGEIKG